MNKLKITIPAHKSIRVELFNEKANYEKRYMANLAYTTYNYKIEQSISSYLSFTFSDLDIPLLVPASKIIVSKYGLPVMFNTTRGSNVKGKFKTDSLVDNSIKITDKVTKVVVEKKEEKKLSKIMIERTWTEIVTRTIVIKNESGQIINSLNLELSEDPANHIIIQENEDNKALKRQGPTLTYEFKLDVDEEKVLVINLVVSKIEKINIPTLKNNEKFDNDFFEEQTEDSFNTHNEENIN
jgi:hypothetical protein